MLVLPPVHDAVECMCPRLTGLAKHVKQAIGRSKPDVARDWSNPWQHRVCFCQLLVSHVLRGPLISDTCIRLHRVPEVKQACITRVMKSLPRHKRYPADCSPPTS